MLAYDLLLSRDLPCLAVRQQAAIVRALADQVDHADASPGSQGLRDQLADELVRLEQKVAATRSVPPESGVRPAARARGV
jgi:hypothetical protein